MPAICRRFLVKGKVQGVFFRDNTRKKARELNLTGWVRNLDDGRVEVLACGQAEDLSILENWLWQGPSSARVEDLYSEDTVFESHSGFAIVD